MQRLQLQIFQVSVYIESDWVEIIDLLRKDFWSYLSSDSPYSASSSFSLTLIKSDQRPTFPAKVSTMQTQNAVTFDEGDHRYCDYYGSLYSVINFSKNKAVLYSLDLEKMHEVAYLMILSRVGKILDIQGLHKLHAFAVAYKNHALVCMMPSKGGKSTMLVELLKDPEIRMISDDIPLIDFKGRVYPFLIKIGMDKVPEEFVVENPEENIYSMKRSQYGVKQLISTRGLKDKMVSINDCYEHIILVEAFRANTPTSLLKKTTNLKMFKGLFKHGVIGIGSPIVIEYFWELGSKDFWVKTFIFLRRMKGFISLCSRAKKYHLYSGYDPQKTAQDLIRVLKRSAINHENEYEKK